MAGICLGLAAGANLSFLYPIAGLLAAAAVADATQKNISVLLVRVAVPTVVVPFVLYVAPISQANSKQFALGPTTLLVSFRGFIVLTFQRDHLTLANWMLLSIGL